MVVFVVSGAVSTNNATVAAYASPKTLATVTQSQGATTRAYASPETAVHATQSQNATVLIHTNPGTAIIGAFVILATVAASASPQARITAAQTLAAVIDASATPRAAIQVLQTQVAQVLAYMQPGVAITAAQVNAVTAQVLAFASPRTLASAFNNYAEAAALFAAIQAGVPQFYTGYKPQPAGSTYFLQSGSWTVPAGTYFYVSATAAGGTPLGVAGRQALGQSLPVVPGDVLTVTIGPNVLVQKGSTTLLSLLDGAAYAKNTGAGLPQDSKIVGLGSGVDSGLAYPACVVFFWR